MLKIEDLNLNKLQELVNTYNEGLLSVELVGSCLNPYIINAHDYDIVFVYNDEEKIKTLQKLFKPIRKELIENYHFDIHLLTIQNDAEKKQYLPALKSMPLLNYSLINNYEVDILQSKKQTIISMKQHCSKFSQLRVKYKTKQWYRIYMLYCILINNSYELTEEQIIMLNKFHDVDVTVEEIEDLIEKVSKL